MGYVVHDPDHRIGSGGPGRRYPGIMSHGTQQVRGQPDIPVIAVDANGHFLKYSDGFMKRSGGDVAGRKFPGAYGGGGGWELGADGASFNGALANAYWWWRLVINNSID